ncbi:uncharacterized protein DS421_1g00530 [Arachis hypogaea]|nr:uncharacterized protein DS421_1g00530 [Arachis hypogaea]
MIMSKVDMQNFIEKSNSLMDRLNAEKERAESLSKILKTIRNDGSITNWWDYNGENHEKNKKIKKALLGLQNVLKNQKSKLAKRS